MGVNAAGTLGGRTSSAEDARIEAPEVARGVGCGVPLPRKFMNFSSQNGVLFFKFMCPMDCSCMICSKKS